MLYWLLLLGKDSKEVEEHKTFAGMLHWMGAWKKGATDPYTVLLPVPGFLGMIQAAMVS